MNELINLVREMRTAQKDFFKAKGVNPIKAKEALQKSRDLEKKVDQMILELTNPQKSLF